MTTKLRRAQEHMEYASGLIRDYLNSGPIRLDTRVSESGESRIVFIAEISPVDNAIPIAIGDALFNFRSSLDHLMMEVIKKYCPPDGLVERNVQFPIRSSPEAFSQWKREDRNAAYLPQEILNSLDALEPYRRPNGFLEVLNRLHNIDKHRYLVCAAANYQSINLLSMFSKESREELLNHHSKMPFGPEAGEAMLRTMSELWIPDRNCRQAVQVGQEITQYPTNQTPGNPVVQFDFSIIEPDVEVRPAIALLQDINSAVLAAHETLGNYL